MPSGRLHAIEAGSLILEIQQNSDTTYRVYDWGRVGLDGRPRDLHLQESLQCIDFGDDEPRPIPPGPNNATLADGEHFRLRRVPLDTDETLGFSARGQPRIVSLVAGELATDEPAHPILQRGANALVPFASSVDFRAIKPSIVLITENFA
jgi:mannose-6-phosphate isomerase